VTLRGGDAPVKPSGGRAFARASPGELWHARRVKLRSLLAAIVAAAIGFGSAGAAEAQLWKPKKKPATTAPVVKKKKPTAAARKRPARKKPTSAVVRFKAPPERDDSSSDSGGGGDDDRDFDDRPRITVVDGDRDE
jgi:hypothetical protein